MARENAEDKGKRYLTEGRLWVKRVDFTHERWPILAECRGAGETHRLGFDKREGWRCSCPARGQCAHLNALMLVTNLKGLT
jgi:hypothetical protein